MHRRVVDVVGTLARLGLAAVWLVAGVLKALDPDGTYVAVRAYDVLPRAAVGPVATALPWLEIVLGLLLLAGVAVRASAVLSAGLLLVFVAGMLQAWARGLPIDCGCFGGGGPVDPQASDYLGALLRDLGFLAVAGWLVIRPRTLAAVDNRFADEDAVVEKDAGVDDGEDDGADGARASIGTRGGQR